MAMLDVSPRFRSSLMPASGLSRTSLCAPSSGVRTSMVISHRSCCRLNASRNAAQSVRGMSRVGMASVSSETRRKCLLDFADDHGTALERLDRPRLVEVQHGVELIGEPRVEVVARALGFGKINDSDRALETRVTKKFCNCAPAKIEHEARYVDVVKK